nr:hypothetical protein [Xanthomonas sacchari]
MHHALGQRIVADQQQAALAQRLRQVAQQHPRGVHVQALGGFARIPHYVGLGGANRSLPEVSYSTRRD